MQSGKNIMAIQNQRHHEIVAQDNHPNWPELLSKTVDDLSRIGRTEIELLETRLKHFIEAQTDNIAGILVLVVALSYGSLFLLGGFVLLLHLWLAWWLSFLIVGIVIAAAGIFFQRLMAARAKAI